MTDCVASRTRASYERDTAPEPSPMPRRSDTFFSVAPQRRGRSVPGHLRGLRGAPRRRERRRALRRLSARVYQQRHTQRRRPTRLVVSFGSRTRGTCRSSASIWGSCSGDGSCTRALRPPGIAPARSTPSGFLGAGAGSSRGSGCGLRDRRGERFRGIRLCLGKIKRVAGCPSGQASRSARSLGLSKVW